MNLIWGGVIYGSNLLLEKYRTTASNKKAAKLSTEIES